VPTTRKSAASPAARSSPSKPPAGPGDHPASSPGGATRVEKDTMGTMEVPAAALYGASTQRAVLNFPVSGRALPESMIRAYALLKAACAAANERLGRLDADRARLIIEACHEIKSGLANHGGLAANFPVDVYQTGSGTSTNVNVNEVVANLVCLRLKKPIGSSKDAAYLKGGGVHPNDHVNMGQSSNDTFPAAMHVAGAMAITGVLLPAVKGLAERLDVLSREWDRIVKIGRTHLQDATPIRLGQEFGGFASQMRHAEERLHRCLHALGELALGGTAVGTGINTHERFGSMVAAELTQQTGVHFREATNHFEAQHSKDAVVEVSGHLKAIATSLSKVASDIRLMGMGPRCGIGELVIPAVQPGSSIMPGKVNPVICESLIMVCCQVIGLDAAITYGNFGGVGGLLDLNVAMPMMATNLLDQITLLARGSEMFNANLLSALKPDEARCASLIEGSLAMCTSLVPVIGYDKSAALAQEAFRQGKTVRQLAYETVAGTADNSGRTITREDIDKYLDPWSMTLPGGEGSAGG
jgi:fumarate hydratase class II